MVAPKYPSFKELSEAFEYKNSCLYRKIKGKDSKIVFSNRNHSTGYCRVRFKKRRIFYHQIVWILNHGDIPKNLIIDHINGNKIDNSLLNLRLSTIRLNGQNRKEHRKGKLVGANYLRRLNKWQANIQIDYQQIYLGLYETEQEAHEAYKDFLKRETEVKDEQSKDAEG